MTIDEKTMNGYIAEAMEKQAPPNWRVDAEVHGQARIGSTSPDIVVNMPYGLRTIVETEYDAPAIADAKTRLGYEFNDYTLPMKSVIAVGIPRHLGNLRHSERDHVLMSDDPTFLMQVVTGKSASDTSIKITPAKPVPVSLRDLVQYAWLAAIPEDYSTQIVRNVVAALQAAKTEFTQMLELASESSQNRLLEIYGSHDSQDRMDTVSGNVVGTLCSMIQLHMNLKEWGHLEQILDIGHPDLWQRVEPKFGMPNKIATEWRKIEAVDYMPLSTIAASMLEDPDLAPKLGKTLKAIHETMSTYLHAGISATTNIAAEIWQSLIPDRNERAAYYTKPATAEFLANLTTQRLKNPSHATYNEICAGTGTLARATEENIRFRHYANSTNKSSIHAKRIERYIQLTDINPQSISVATANMTSLEPETAFDSSAIFAITANGGALNFLTKEGVSDLENELIGRNGAQGEMLSIVPLATQIICNNDPYYRAGADAGAKNPISEELMRKYKRLADQRVKGVANGTAGLATFMHVIEHEMLGKGCPHGKVLPLTAARAPTYSGLRRNIENEYYDVIAVSTASGDGASMSADTEGHQEMLLIGTKHNGATSHAFQNGDRSVTCVNLNNTFTTKLEAKMFADAVKREVAKGKPYGQITVGDDVGSYYRMTNLGDGKPWSLLGSRDELTTLISHVSNARTWNVATGKLTPHALPMTTIDKIAKSGVSDGLIGRTAGSTSPRGAFVMHKAKNTHTRINPSLYSADADKQITITCQPTHYGTPRESEDKVLTVLQTAGHFHLSQNLRMSSQKIIMAHTETKCLGGTAWITINADQGVAEAINLFLNSVYGIILRTGHGIITHQGRSRIFVETTRKHPIPDFASKTEAGQKARNIALANFEEMRKLRLERISLSAIDHNRAAIDKVVTQMLGIPWNMETDNMLAYWRKIVSLSPNIHGNNKDVLKILAGYGIHP